MTISNTDDPVAGPFEGDDSQTVFPFEFKVFAETDLQVVVSIDGVQSTLVLDSDYSVSMNADQNANPGGDITYPLSGDPLADGDTLTAISNLEYTQTTSIANRSGFYPKVIENALDRCVMLIKQASTGLSRSIRLPLSDSGVNTELPGAISRLDRLIAFGSDSGGVQVSDFTATQVASAIAAAYSAGASTADAVMLAHAGTSIIRSVQDKLREKRSIKDFGAIGDGSAHPLSERYSTLIAAQTVYPFATALTQQIDFCATQAALNYAATIVNTSSFQGSCVGIEAPEGDFYMGADTLKMLATGIYFFGAGGRGSRFWTDQNTSVLEIGDSTDATSTFHIYLDGLFFDSEDDDNTATGIKIYRTFFGGITHCLLRNFSTNVATFRANRFFINQNIFSGQRSVIGTAHISIAGSASGNGGGLHIFDNEIGNSNGVLLPDYTSGILVEGVDTIYHGINHIRDVGYGMRIAPTGGTGKNFISDVMAVGPNYMDEIYTTCLYIGGSIAAGGTYQNIQYIGGLLRAANAGATNAAYCVDIDITDAGGFVAGGGAVQGIKIMATMRLARITAVRARGGSSGRIEVQGLDLDGCHFARNNTGGAAVYSCVDIEIGSGRMCGWTVFGDTIAVASIANINVSNPGSIIEGDHDLTQTNCTGDPVLVAATGSPADVLRKPSLIAGLGKRLMSTYTKVTTDRSPAVVFSRSVESTGQVQRFKAVVLGVSTSGTAGSARAIYEVSASVYRQNGGTAAVQVSAEAANYSNLTSNDAPVKASLLTGTAWAGGAAVAAKDMITSGGNVYLVQVAGNLDATNPPVHLSGSQANGTATLGFVAAVAVNTFALIVSGQSATTMSWAVHQDYAALP